MIEETSDDTPPPVAPAPVSKFNAFRPAKEKPCCGSKGIRHKKMCGKRYGGGDGSLPPDDGPVIEEPVEEDPDTLPASKDPVNWKCVECAAVVKARMKPGYCPDCNNRILIQET